MSRAAAGTAVRDALAAATDALAAAGVDSPRFDAELLLERASGVDRARLAADPDAPLDGAAARAFAGMVRRRARREPVAYILGDKAFRHIELAVDPRVLIPRPETELLVEIALELEPERVLDVGTGSGAVALAIADELPAARAVATDTSAAALEVAAANASRLGLGERVAFELGTLPARGGFDLLLANLPYVPEADWAGLQPEIRDHEPRAALVPGATGLEAISSLVAALAGRAADVGAVALEVGAGQAGAVADLLRDGGFAGIEARRDLAGIERAVLARERAGAGTAEPGR